MAESRISLYWNHPGTFVEGIDRAMRSVDTYLGRWWTRGVFPTDTRRVTLTPERLEEGRIGVWSKNPPARTLDLVVSDLPGFPNSLELTFGHDGALPYSREKCLELFGKLIEVVEPHRAVWGEMFSDLDDPLGERAVGWLTYVDGEVDVPACAEPFGSGTLIECGNAPGQADRNERQKVQDALRA